MWVVARYLLTGVANTLIGVLVIFALMAAGAGPRVANVTGYAVGLVVSFLLNRRWTFASSRPVRETGALFFLVFLVSYAVNYSVLTFGMEVLAQNPYVAQLAAVLAYTVVNYFGCRYFVFREAR